MGPGLGTAATLLTAKEDNVLQCFVTREEGAVWEPYNTIESIPTVMYEFCTTNGFKGLFTSLMLPNDWIIDIQNRGASIYDRINFTREPGVWKRTMDSLTKKKLDENPPITLPNELQTVVEELQRKLDRLAKLYGWPERE